MKGGVRIAIVGLILAALATGLVYLRYAFFPKYRWSSEYGRHNDQPYGLKLIYDQLRHHPGVTAKNVVDPDRIECDSCNYVFIGKDVELDSLASISLLGFVSRGNRALIATDDAPMDLLLALNAGDSAVTHYQYAPSETAVVRFEGDTTQEALRFNFQKLKDKSATYHWGGYPAGYFFNQLTVYGFQPIAFINDTLVTAFSVKHGEGELVFHTNPILFSNYYMISERGYVHANHMLGRLHKAQVYWHDPSTAQPVGEGRTNPIQLLFTHRSLTAAWYVFLAGILLYLVIRAKREQRVIPPPAINNNTSIEFARAVGSLYFRQGGQTHIASEMHALLMADLFARYRTNPDLPAALLYEQVSKKSGVDQQLVADIFRQLNFIRKSTTATAEELLAVYQKIETFNRLRK